MNEILKRKKFFAFAFLIILFAIISIFFPYTKALVFIQPEKDDILCYVPIAAGDTFKIQFKHSIHLSDVIENYVITDQDEIRLYELEYEDFAVGMPSEAGEGETFEIKDGKYFIKNMNRTFEHFDLRIGQVRANHTLVFGDVSYPLSRAIEPGTKVRVKVKKISIIQKLEGVDILGRKK